jgi:hypothetical protein
LTSKRLDSWIKFKFDSNPTTATDLATENERVSAEQKRKDFLISEKKKELEREARILRNINLNTKKQNGITK